MSLFQFLPLARDRWSRRSLKSSRRHLQLESLEHRHLLALEPIMVVNTDDDGPGSLRWAIEQANQDPDKDSIHFAIPGNGPHRITPGATSSQPTGNGGLPPILYPVDINGYSQPGSAPNTAGSSEGINAQLKIELRGTSAGASNGLTIRGGNSSVRGLVINQFAGT